MTFKDKPQRPGGKPARSDKKPYTGARKTAAAPSGDESTEIETPRKPRPTATETVGADVPQRISKIMARAGVASRRDIERMIMEGRVSLNGKLLDSPVVNATLADHIEVDGQPIRGIERTRLWLYHKPSGLVTTNSDPEGRPTVFDNLPEDLPRVLSIGRLDINTEGLLLLTNDGGLARVLELPATGWLRRYRVRAHGVIDQAALDKLKDGIAVDGVLYGAIDATLDKVQGSNVWITMGLREGKNREIKNVMGALGLDVNRLIRISYGPFQLGELPEGHAQEIRGRTLRDQLGPRLIEEAKANFDAPIFDAAAAEEEKPQKNEWAAGKPEARERGAFKEKAGDKRERALSRLDTKRDDRAGGRPERGGRDAPEAKFDGPKREPGFRARKANVWMAPGARPLPEKKPKDAQAADVAEKPVRRERPEGAPAVKRYGKTKDGLPMKSNRKFDPDRKKASVYDRPDRGPRVIVTRDDDDKDWIRATEEPSRDEGRGGDRKRSGGDDRGARSFGDRAPRGDRPQGDRPRGARPQGDRPPRREGGDKPFGDRKPRAEGARSFSDRPKSDRPAGDRPPSDRPRKPFGEKSFSREDGDRKPRDFGDRPPRGDRPQGDRPPRREGDRPFGGKPSGDRPAGGKSFGAKPGGAKPFGTKTGGPRKPGGGKPSGGRPPAGGKPRGRGN
ncbi:pseudouridine synthase [Rhizobium herbae]|uniref:Pseudouridine synthase n=1 Tax=Rhizobium herbae TaxID=508661 RepID=A0ABS4ENA0_9HYPH|nr:pseudouridine synthase [Rhizobium herbae]MBP1859434.1 23S rRNA pseudouridine2605 synthase [Rhizobium herbae]